MREDGSGRAVLPVHGGRQMQYISVTPSDPSLRLLGRMDLSRKPLALDWTGSGLECSFRGSDLWAELEAPAASPVM